jgi:hypothetical protein
LQFWSLQHFYIYWRYFRDWKCIKSSLLITVALALVAIVGKVPNHLDIVWAMRWKPTVVGNTGRNRCLDKTKRICDGLLFLRIKRKTGGKNERERERERKKRDKDIYVPETRTI